MTRSSVPIVVVALALSLLAVDALSTSSALLPALQAGEPAQPPKPEFSPEITADQVLARTAFLASEELAGRTGGTAGGKLTEAYIASEFERLGLTFVGSDKDIRFTTVQLPTQVPIASQTSLEISIAKRPAKTVRGTDGPMPLSMSSLTSGEGGLVFVGYGLRSEKNKLDEYAGLDVKGKIVLVLRRGPNETDKESPWFTDPNPRARRRSNPELAFGNKVKSAVAAGAAGVLFVNNRHAKNDDIPLRGGRARFPIPVMSVSRALAKEMLAAAGLEPDVEQSKIDAELKPHSSVIEGVAVALRPAFAEGVAHNVVAIKKGSDPELSKQAVLIGAHMDHVGFGWFGSLDGSGKLHSGADDNASGTAALLEIAERLAAAPPTKRTLIFASWCGEEMGLIGSKHYTTKPLWKLEDTVACVNLDMVGRYDLTKKRGPGLSVGGVPTGSTFTEPVERLCKQYKLQFQHSWWGWGQSDQANFYRKGVPSLFFSTGLHPDYHRATDTWEKINSSAQATIASMAADLIVELANADTRPVFKKRPQRPVLGVRMSDTDDGSGARLIQVVPKLGAGKAGLKRGDVVTAVDGKPVKNQEALSQIIQSTKPGAVLEVTYLRAKETKTVKVTVSGSDR